MDTPLPFPQNHDPQSKVAFAAGVFALGLGLVVVFGWHTHNLSLLRLHEGWVAMAYNTAVGFILGGAGLIVLTTKRPQFAALPGGLLLLLFGLTLAEHIFDADFGIDELVMKAYVRSGIVHNGRMAINTALCGTITGAYLLLNAVPFSRTGRAYRRRSGVSALLAAVVVGLAVVGLTAYLSDAASAYEWGKLARMAVHTVFGFVVLGMGLIARAWHEEKGHLPPHAAPRWLPLLMGVGMVAASVCLWQVISVEQNAHGDALRKLAAAAKATDTTGIPFESLARERQFIPAAVLVSGLTLGAALTFAVYFAQTARFRAALVETANRALQEEIGQREKAERDRQTALDELQKANDALEIRVQSRTADLETANASLRGEMLSRQKAQAQNARLLKEAAQNALHQKAFLREVLSSVTEGHLRLCESPDDLPRQMPTVEGGEPIALTSATLRDLRAAVRHVAEALAFPPIRIADLMTAVGEASMNAVVHGGGICEADVRAENGTVQVWITDHGKGIAWDNLHRATLERGYTTASSLGHGFWLMLKTCDRVFLLTGAGGTTVVLEQDCDPYGPSWLDDRA